jgi:hypothetical protein
MNETRDPDPNKQISPTNPFANVGQGANQNNFALTANTSAWFSTNSMMSGNNTDLAGNTRSSSRGALQFSASGLPPAPPTGLSANVQ